jgi:hypothetical protein
MTYAIKPLNCDPKKLHGLSEKLIIDMCITNRH